MKVGAKKVHMVGIGGIAVSALAQFYLSEGWRVSGSDKEDSDLIGKLRKMGAKVFIGHRASHVPTDADLVVYSPAVPRGNPERRVARTLGIREMTHAEALGEIAKGHVLVAISGAHGKSTTTAMVALMMVRAGFDPTVFIGTKVREFGGSNFRKGTSPWIIIEADEFSRSFLHYRPFITITTNIDREHLEYYKTFANIKKAFKQLWNHSGRIIANSEDRAVKSMRPKKVLWYGTRGPRGARVKHLLKIPGRHNLSNAMAVDKLGDLLKIPASTRDKTFAAFGGTWRRFELKGIKNGVRIYDDYGHHPTEIKATLAGAREAFPKNRIVVLFQPHHSSRLELLFQEFSKAFDDAEEKIILETYKVPGRDEGKPDPKRNAKTLAEKIGAVYARTQGETIHILKRVLKRGDVLIVMGAGDIWKVSEQLCQPGR